MAQNYVEDTFTEASNTALTSHTPDTGTGWTEVFNDSASSIAQVYGTGDYVAITTGEGGVGIACSAEPDPDTAAYVIEAKELATVISTRNAGLFARRTDNSNYYVFQILGYDDTPNDRKIFKRVSGSFVELAATDEGDAAGQFFQFIITDSKKSVRQDGREILSTSDNALTSKGDCGLAWGSPAGGDGNYMSADWQFDDFRSYDIPQESNPDSDVTKGNWTDELGGTTNIYTSIDETSASDSDYVESGDSPNLDVLEVGLGNPSDPSTGDGHYVHVRYRKQGTETIDLRVRLLQGATEIASWTYSGISTSFVYKREKLTTTQANNITDYSNLRFEFRADVP